MNHREIDFTTAFNKEGDWRWTLHPKLKPNVLCIIVSGKAATQEEAIIAARAAIDKALDEKSDLGQAANAAP
jgi:hypothetical protein